MFTACRCFPCFIQGYICCFTFRIYIALLFVAYIFDKNGSQVFHLLKFDYHKSFWKTCLNLSEKSRGRISCRKVFVCLFWVFCFYFFKKKIPVAEVWKIENIRVKRRNANKWINVLSPTVENGVCFNQLLSTWFYISK